jgi:hypothetical protein
MFPTSDSKNVNKTIGKKAAHLLGIQSGINFSTSICKKVFPTSDSKDVNKISDGKKAANLLGIQSGIILAWSRHVPYTLDRCFSKTQYSSTSLATASLPWIKRPNLQRT